MSYVYHGSSRGDLRALTPRAGTHGRPFVYATRHPLIALLFLSRWNDFLLTLHAAESDRRLHVALTERYAGALEEIYRGKGGFIYTLPESGFAPHPACWELEVVSERAVTPLACRGVDDILAALEAHEAAGDITLWRYPARPPAIPADDSDLVGKALELYRLSGDVHNARYCAERFPHLREALKAAFLAELDLELPTI